MYFKSITAWFTSLSLLAATPAAIGQTLELTPTDATVEVGETHTVVATLLDDMGAPMFGIPVMFSVVSGPNGGDVDDDVTNIAGNASFSCPGDGGGGIDTIVAFAELPAGPIVSNAVQATWVAGVGIADNGCPGTRGVPTLTLTGDFEPTSETMLSITGGLPSAAGVLLVGLDAARREREGCTLMFQPLLYVPFMTDATGAFMNTARWPAGLLALDEVYFQAYILDAGAPTGFASTNTVIITAP